MLTVAVNLSRFPPWLKDDLAFSEHFSLTVESQVYASGVVYGDFGVTRPCSYKFVEVRDTTQKGHVGLCRWGVTQKIALFCTRGPCGSCVNSYCKCGHRPWAKTERMTLNMYCMSTSPKTKARIESKTKMTANESIRQFTAGFWVFRQARVPKLTSGGGAGPSQVVHSVWRNVTCTCSFRKTEIIMQWRESSV